MTTKQRVVGIEIDGVVTWHAAEDVSGAGYDTLCALDANDPSIGTKGEIIPRRGQKITCRQCYAIWKGVLALKLREGNFDVE